MKKRTKYSEQFATKTFGGKTTKDAYMKAVKWYASNVISKDDLHNVQVEFVKDKSQPKVTLRLYASMDESEVGQNHCDCCKEMHHAFFINESTDCNKCNMQGYRNRLERKMSVIVGYCSELLRTSVNKGE